jgi:2-oxoisovalerate dehydrogenase E2 component (dihydrolipoyl transacylase)
MTATMIKEFRLPDLGEGLTESEIVSWKVGVGDTVSLNQIIAEVETAKAVVELPSPFAGVITALHEQPGTVVEVGKPIVSFEVKDDAGNQTAAAAPAEAALPKREPNLVGYGAVVESTGRPVRRQRTLVQPTPVAEPAPVVKPVETRFADANTAERPRSTPPVRKLAKDLGVDLESVPGSGPSGLITRDDVRNFVGGGDLPAAAWELAAQDVQPRRHRASVKCGHQSRASASSLRLPWSAAPLLPPM